MNQGDTEIIYSRAGHCTEGIDQYSGELFFVLRVNVLHCSLNGLDDDLPIFSGSHTPVD